MKYIVQIEIDPVTGIELEASPARIQEIVGKWQELNPIGFYAYATRRAMTVILDLPNEDSMFEALHATWVVTNNYPEVSPVVDAEEFPKLLQRVGIGQ
jgi:hypothetical protein